MPIISVIVPVYKVESYLSRCVDSILNQSYHEFELVLVDDGSPDNCGEICEEYAKKDRRVHVLHRNNGGLSAARNTGIEWALHNSDSEWITFIDSDDWIDPRYLELLYRAVQDTGLSAAVGGFERTDGTYVPTTIGELVTPTVWETEAFYCANKVNATVAWGKLYRKQDFAVVRYPEGKIHEDEFTTYKILFPYERIAVIEQPLYAYFQNSQSIMGSQWSPKHMAEAEGMLEELQYFAANGFANAEAYTARAYLNSLYRNLQRAKAFGRRYQAEVSFLKSQLRSALREYGKTADVNIHKNQWLYYEAFPWATIPYRAAQKLIEIQK